MAASRLRLCALAAAVVFVSLLLAVGFLAAENARLRERAFVAEARLESAFVSQIRAESLAREARAEADQLARIFRANVGDRNPTAGAD
jgi:hypothetical protein